ncbi:MAG TPA: XRE family transcriptional regulator [Pseudogracilibacillus sp.]|nr:XRE family transcriptional regulator [Pseudogracilibacillus sp.]
MRERSAISLDHIGITIKQLRLRQKKTQQQIADECGISKSLLSKIENGQTSSAIATLSKISNALDVPLSWLLEDNVEKDIVLLSASERQSKVGNEHMGYSYELLANRSPYTGVEPTIVHVTPKDTNLREEKYTHSHDEFIYILTGAIELSYDGKSYFMKQGDTAYFNGMKPHLFIPVDNEGAEVLTLFIESTE